MGIMTSNLHLRCIVPLLLWFCSHSLSAEILHQKLHASLDPASGQLQVEAELTLPEGLTADFLLHRGLNPRSQTPGVSLVETEQIEGQVPLTRYRVQRPADLRRISLSYAGRISHSLTRQKESPGRSLERLAGTISSEGVHLDASTAWYPRFPGQLQTFKLEADLPQGWLAVSQGAGPEIEQQGQRQLSRWQSSQPQDEIYLIAAPFHLYRRDLGDIEAQVFLRQSDHRLAERYLDATQGYLDLYQPLIGPYPYAKFALVENFWQTGYGMPSFTLLGSRVIRLPFILHSSYPHEILHNWWGNSVYVDYAKGNWSEGLTSYLADHLLAEQRGRGSGYRRSALQRYADFIRHDNDFPLREFRGRHSTASQAVGYDKSLMLFHMLRRDLGDKMFIHGLRRFYADNRFRSAGFPQLQSAFEAVSGRSLERFFRQWIDRTGAPRLALDQVQMASAADGYRLSGRLRQTQPEAPFDLRIPLSIERENGSHQLESIEMNQRELRFQIDLTGQPLALHVDPWFDLFRSLAPEETPPTLSQLFGSERVLILLPADAEEQLQQGYRDLANSWATDYRQAEVRFDNEVEKLPKETPVLLLGWENRFTTGFLEALSDYPLNRSAESLELWNQTYGSGDHSFVLTGRSGGSQTRVWVATRNPQSLPGLARKLPHYGKYSALAFAGDAPDNRLKRQWPVTGSPLQHLFSELKSPPPPEPAPLTP
jgi:hypothetical protein